MVHLSGQVYCLYLNRQHKVVLLHNRWGPAAVSEIGGVKGKKENEINLTGVGGDGKTGGEDGKINRTRTWSSLITVILFCRMQVLQGRKIAYKMLLLVCMWKVGD